ncbi:MAG: hypothetical protein V1736_07325 [Pseudomonadota bacterium]
MGALSVGDVRTGTIPSLLPSQKHYLKVYRTDNGTRSRAGIRRKTKLGLRICRGRLGRFCV